MSLIDQRILIVAPVEAVWSYVADPALLTKWNRACKQVSVLSTRSTGVGARRRCVGQDGKAVVEETTAYFENIGYEYRVVDGPYKDFRGRFRLQAIPDGTVVNWTVEYHLRGMLPGVRNFVNFRRQYEDMMAESLRQLRKLVEASGIRLDPEEHARFAMQDAPSVEARASWSSESTKPVARNAHDPMKGVSVGEDDLPNMPAASIPSPVPPSRLGNDFSPATIVNAGAGLSVPKPEVTVPGARQALDRAASGEPPLVPLSDTANMEPVAPGARPGEKKLDTKPRPPVGLREAIAAQSSRDLGDTAGTGVPSAADLERAATAPTVPISLVAPPAEPPAAQETQTMPVPAAQNSPNVAGSANLARPTGPAVLSPVPSTAPIPPSTLPERVPTPPPGSLKTPPPPAPGAPPQPAILEPARSLEDTDVRIPAMNTPPSSTVDNRWTQPTELQPAKQDGQGVPGGSGGPLHGKRDSSELSIWDVFGIERPSERVQAELQAAIASLQPSGERTENTEGQPAQQQQSQAAIPGLEQFSSSRKSATSGKPARSKAQPKVRRAKAGAPRQKTKVSVRPLNRQD